MMLHTENQLPRTAQIVIIPGLVWLNITVCNTTPGDLVLGLPGNINQSEIGL